jgi:branched-chain amino acid transport system substrate-binding protein
MPSAKGWLSALILSACWPMAAAIQAQPAYDPGVSDTEIKIGQTAPYSGPVSAVATVARAIAAYIAKINADGGIAGRKITFISVDDGYAPPKTVEQTRKLVEGEGVFLMFSSVGTPTNAAVQKYLNAKGVPQLFVQSGAARWNDPKNYPWSIAGLPDYDSEARVYAKYLLANKADARIGVLYQNDDLGRDYLKGLKSGLGERAAEMIVSEQSYEIADPTVDSQIINLSRSGADTFFSFALQRTTAQAIRKAAEIGWHPLFFVPLVSNSINTVLTPAGLDNSTGLMSAAVYKDPSDPRWQNDPDYRAWLAWMNQYYPGGNVTETLNVAGYTLAQMLIAVLQRCGGNFTRENVMKKATNLDGLHLPMLLPGVSLRSSPDDFRLYRQFQLQRFDGMRWVLVGAPIGS